MSVTARKSPQKDHIEWMKQSGYTEADLDRFWQENYGTNPVVTNLTDHGMTWRDMNLCVVQQLPTQKQRDEEYRRLKELEAKAAEEAARIEDEARKYYWEHFEELMLKKIEAKEKLTEEELKELVTEYDEETIYGDDHRWTREACTIVKICDRYFAIDWMKALTEMQEDEFYEQPYAVRQVERVVVTKEWVTIDEE